MMSCSRSSVSNSRRSVSRRHACASSARFETPPTTTCPPLSPCCAVRSVSATSSSRSSVLARVLGRELQQPRLRLRVGQPAERLQPPLGLAERLIVERLRAGRGSACPRGRAGRRRGPSWSAPCRSAPGERSAPPPPTAGPRDRRTASAATAAARSPSGPPRGRGSPRRSSSRSRAVARRGGGRPRGASRRSGGSRCRWGSGRRWCAGG